eukprot:g510.t1
MYRREELIKECASQRWARYKLKKLKNGKKRTHAMQDIFNAFDSWILSLLTKGKGAKIPNFGTFTWDVKNRIPIFVPSNMFLKTFGVVSDYGQIFFEKLEKRVAKSSDINYSKLAINFSENYTKDIMFCAIRDMILRIGRACSKSRDVKVKIAFSFGTLFCKRHRVSFQFSSEFKFETAKICEEREVEYLLAKQDDEDGQCVGENETNDDHVEYGQEEDEEEVVYEYKDDEVQDREQYQEGKETEERRRYHPQSSLDHEFQIDDSEFDPRDLTNSLHFATSAPIKYRDGEVARRKREKVLEDAYQRHLGDVHQSIDAENTYLEEEMELYRKLHSEKHQMVQHRISEKERVKKALEDQIQIRNLKREEEFMKEKMEKMQLYPPLESFDLDMMENVQREKLEQEEDENFSTSESERPTQTNGRIRSKSSNRYPKQPPLSTEQLILRAQRKDELLRKRDHGNFLKEQMNAKKTAEMRAKYAKKLHEKKFLRALHQSAAKLENESKSEMEKRQRELMEAWKKDCSVRQKYRKRRDSLQAMRREFMKDRVPQQQMKESKSSSNFSSVGFDMRKKNM